MSDLSYSIKKLQPGNKEEMLVKDLLLSLDDESKKFSNENTWLQEKLRICNESECDRKTTLWHSYHIEYDETAVIAVLQKAGLHYNVEVKKDRKGSIIYIKPQKKGLVKNDSRLYL